MFPAIAALYCSQMATEGGSSHSVIGIDLGGTLTAKQRKGLVRSLAQAIRSELKETESIDFMFLDGSIGEQIRTSGIPIFVKPDLLG